MLLTNLAKVTRDIAVNTASLKRNPLLVDLKKDLSGGVIQYPTFRKTSRITLRNASRSMWMRTVS